MGRSQSGGYAFNVPCRNGVNKVMWTGRKVAALCSLAVSRMVRRKRSWRADGLLADQGGRPHHFLGSLKSPSALAMLVFVIMSFTLIIPNANQAAWLSGGLLKISHPNAEVGHCGTTRRERLSEVTNFAGRGWIGTMGFWLNGSQGWAV